MENTFACLNILFILIYRHKKKPTKTCVTINRSKLKTKVLSIRPNFFFWLTAISCRLLDNLNGKVFTNSKHGRHKIVLFKCCEVYCLWFDIYIFSKIIFFSNLDCLFRHCNQHKYIQFNLNNLETSPK